MASVLSSKAKFYRCDPREGNETDHYVESDADIFIKELSHKQLRTKTSLEEQLSQKKEFQLSHSYRPITEHTSGALSYDDFKQITVSAENQSINIINSDLQNSNNVSRHMRELALAVKPNSTETRLLEFAISCHAVGKVKPDNRPVDHPINHLHDFENQLFGHPIETGDPAKTAKTILRKRKQLLEATSEPIQIESKSNCVDRQSLWDVTERVPVKKRPSEKVYSCRKEKLFTIRDGKIIPLKDDCSARKEPTSVGKQPSAVEPAAAACLPEKRSQSRLSEDEIRKLPKFRNYERGKPTKTLYLKNLSSRVTKTDLSTLFCEFQKSDRPLIVYNLMKSGRMRGQAFVDFHCVETATKAFEKLNGYIVHGKPLIIEFSKSKR